jgi:hypothetical protein
MNTQEHIAEMLTLLRDAARAWNNENESELDAVMERVECFLIDSRDSVYVQRDPQYPPRKIACREPYKVVGTIDDNTKVLGTTHGEVKKVIEEGFAEQFRMIGEKEHGK